MVAVIDERGTTAAAGDPVAVFGPDALDAAPTPSADPLPTGSRRETLTALRDDLAARIPAAEDRDAAALSRQLVAVLAEIDDLPDDAAAATPLGALLSAVPD